MILYLTKTSLFFHYLLDLRATGTHAPSVAHPTTKSNTGLIANWADQVADAASLSPMLRYASSEVGLGRSPLASGSHVDSTFPVYQPGGLELDGKDDILAGTPTKCVSRFFFLLFSLYVTDIVTAAETPQTRT